MQWAKKAMFKKHKAWYGTWTHDPQIKSLMLYPTELTRLAKRRWYLVDSLLATNITRDVKWQLLYTYQPFKHC